MPTNPALLLSAKDAFLALPENQLAMAAVEELLQPGPYRQGRLAFVSGASGVGKSLLIREALRQWPSKARKEKSAVLTASQFAAELAEASQSQTIEAFQTKYRSLDQLILEDVSALAGRKQSQEQLCLAVDEILAHGGRVLATSTVSAGSLPRFSRRLVNRFQGGVTAAMELPGFESRVKLLNHFAAARQIALPPSVSEILAEALPVSPRELLGALVQLETLAQRHHSPPTTALAEYYLSQETLPEPLALSEVAKAVARQFGVPMSGLRGKKRASGVVLPRQCAMFLARELTGQSLLAIAEFFGRKHHSTVLHACKRMERALSKEPALRQHLAQIRAALGAHPAKGSCG
jgi:chromosomal replication initiator protein